MKANSTASPVITSNTAIIDQSTVVPMYSSSLRMLHLRPLRRPTPASQHARHGAPRLQAQPDQKGHTIYWRRPQPRRHAPLVQRLTADDQQPEVGHVEKSCRPKLEKP